MPWSHENTGRIWLRVRYSRHRFSTVFKSSVLLTMAIPERRTCYVEIPSFDNASNNAILLDLDGGCVGPSVGPWQCLIIRWFDDAAANGLILTVRQRRVK